MAQERDYHSLIRELLAGVGNGWSYGHLKGWLVSKYLHQPELARWLQEYGQDLMADEEIRSQLGHLAQLRRGELAEMAEEMLQGWEPQVEEWEQWFDRGNELLELGRYEEAIVSYDKAIEFRPDFYPAWYSRGIALDNLGRYKEAILSFDKAIEFQPDFYQALNDRGIALYNLGRHEEAIASFDRSIELKPDGHRAWRNKGASLNILGKYEEAISIFNQAIDLKPDYSIALYNRGIALNNVGRHEEAITSYERVIAIDPNYPDALSNLGSVLGKLERYEEALAIFNRAIKLKPDDCRAWDGRGNTLCYLGRYDEAIDSCDRAVNLEPNHSNAWSSRGRTLSYLGKYKEAIYSCNRAIKLELDCYQAWCNRAIAIGNIEGYQAAINAYNEACQHIKLDSHPDGWGLIQRSIGRAHYREGKNQLFNHRANHQLYYKLALTAYHKALQTLTREHFPSLRLETLLDLSKVYLAQQNLESASETQAEAVDIFRDLLNAQPTVAGKKRLQLKYSGLRQFNVDLFVARGDNIRALEAAELDKNNCLTWLLSSFEQTTISPSFEEMKGLLGSSRKTSEINAIDGNPPTDRLQPRSSIGI